MDFAFDLLNASRHLDALQLYAPALPAESPIKRALEYVASVWLRPCFDLWEEVYGHHFYTRYVQMAALQKGAKLARAMNDSGAANWYELHASLISETLGQFSKRQDFISASLHPIKSRSGLDIAPLLAVLHAWDPELQTDVSLDHPLLLATIARLEASFDYALPDPWIGRYPEDVYDGLGYSRGNPWTLTTLALAQHAFALISRIQPLQALTIDTHSLPFYKRALNASWVAPGRYSFPSPHFLALVQALADRGDTLLAVARVGWSEQIDRDFGTPCGARNLTWTYVAYLNAVDARRSVFGEVVCSD